MNKKYYFTYGTEGQPFVGGWTEVEAPNADIACAAFRAIHHDKEPGILNCSSAYTEEVFLKSCMIETLEHKDEILVEYRKSLSAPEAALIVDRRHKEMEEAARRRAAMKSAQEVQEAAQAKIEEVLNEEPAAPVSTPVEQPIPAEAPAEKIYQASFRVRSSIGKLKALKEFLVNGGYDYEQF